MSDSVPIDIRWLDELAEAWILAVRHDGDWRAGLLNAPARAILGSGPEAGSDPPLAPIYAESMHPRSRVALERALEAGEPFLGEVDLRDASGRTFTAQCKVVPLEAGRALWIFREIDQRKEARRELAIERELRLQMLSKLEEGVILAGPDTRIESFNRAAEQITGWKAAEALGESADLVFRLIDSHSRDPLSSPASRIAKTNLRYSMSSGCQLLRRQGGSVPITFSGSPFQNPRGEFAGVILVFKDDTARVQLQREQVQSQNLETVNQLAGGIAHDFNNLLTAVIGNLSLALDLPAEHTGAAAGLLDKVESAMKAATRARNLSQQLLSLSRGHAPVISASTTRNLIQETAGFSLTGSALRAEILLPDDLWTCLVDEGKIAQVINNLLINARQAVGGAGRVRVSAENVKIFREGGLPLKPGHYVKILIEDNGPGIPPAHLSRIFEPYFTTKRDGSGLGLANCKTIIRQHQGHIAVESELGRGTCFTLFLPAEPGRAVEVEEGPPAEVFRGKGRILVMDDDPLVQQIVADILEHLGYEPVLASNGHELLEIVAGADKAEAPFTAVIVDLTVPGSMGGLDAKNHLEKIAPELPVIVSSGYANDPVLMNFHEHGFAGVAMKPFNIQQLSQVLKESIESPGGAYGGGKKRGRRSTPYPFQNS